MIENMTTVATPLWARLAVWSGLPAACAALLFGADRLADFVVRLPWAPLRGPFKLVQQVPEPQATIGALVLGAIAGLVLAWFVEAESITVRVSRTEVEMTRPGVRRVVPLGEVAVAFHERDQLVLLGRTGQELAREPFLLSPKRIAPALRERGIAWAEKDPYAEAYRRWLPDLPEVAAGPGAVFAARQKALDSGDSRDAAELREELARQGYVVRDDRKRQYWRRVG